MIENNPPDAIGRKGVKFINCGMPPLFWFFLASPPLAASPRAAVDLKSACANEAGMLCSEVKNDPAALRACLLEQQDSLMAGCRGALFPNSPAKGKRAPAPVPDEPEFLESGFEAQNARAFHAKAKAGNAEAANDLANMINQGRGVKNNGALALRWFLEAANKGHSGAQYTLGFFYETGRAGPIDNAEAYAWYYAYAGSNPASRSGPFPTYSQFEPAIIKKLKKLEALLSHAEVSAARERGERAARPSR